MRGSQSRLVLVRNDMTTGREIDPELMHFIDRVVVPILVRRWVEQSVTDGAEKEVNCEELAVEEAA